MWPGSSYLIDNKSIGEKKSGHTLPVIQLRTMACRNVTYLIKFLFQHLFQC